MATKKTTEGETKKKGDKKQWQCDKKKQKATKKTSFFLSPSVFFVPASLGWLLPPASSVFPWRKQNAFVWKIWALDVRIEAIPREMMSNNKGLRESRSWRMLPKNLLEHVQVTTIFFGPVRAKPGFPGIAQSSCAEAHNCSTSHNCGPTRRLKLPDFRITFQVETAAQRNPALQGICFLSFGQLAPHQPRITLLA